MLFVYYTNYTIYDTLYIYSQSQEAGIQLRHWGTIHNSVGGNKMAFALSLLLLFFITICTLYIYRHFTLRRQLARIPSPRSHPFIGHMLVIKPDIEGFIDQILGMAQIYPRIVLFWAGPLPTLMIYSAKVAESLFTNMNHIDKGFAYDLLRPWLGNGLLTNYSDSWRIRRKLLTPTFHYDILKNFQHVFNHQANILIQKLSNLITSNGNIIPDIAPLISLCTLDIICETSMGKSVNAQGKSDSDYVKAVLRINDIIHRRQKNPLMWFNVLFWLFGDGKEHAWALNILHSFTRKVIIERRRMREHEGALMNIEGRLAFLDLLLEMEQNGSINDTDIQHEVDTFMFEGHDTTAAALVWLLFMLGCHQDVQQRCFDEIQSVCGLTGDVSIEDLSKLTYLECCVKETLRLYPSAPFITRTLGSNSKIGGHELPQGTQVMLNIYLIHRDPEQWKDPEIFNPDRFMRENMKGRHAFAYVPFSAGSRNCIGQRFALLEEKTLIIWILRKFHVETLKRRDQIWTNAELILRPGSAMPIKLTSRMH